MFSVIMLLSDLWERQLTVAWQSKWQIDYEPVLKKEKRNKKKTYCSDINSQYTFLFNAMCDL